MGLSPLAMDIVSVFAASPCVVLAAYEGLRLVVCFGVRPIAMLGWWYRWVSCRRGCGQAACASHSGAALNPRPLSHRLCVYELSF